jgi:hypothetical protein
MTHSIGKVQLTINAPRRKDGFALQTAASDWFWQKVLPALDVALTEIAPDAMILKLDRLDVELPATNWSNWEEKLPPSVIRAIVEEILRRRFYPRPSDAPVEISTLSENGFAAWFFF